MSPWHQSVSAVAVTTSRALGSLSSALVRVAGDLIWLA
jgi:hypothetical protein